MKTSLLSAVCLAAAVVVSLPGFVMSQEGEPPSQYEHVKGLEPFIGRWRGTSPGPDGAERQLTITCRWAANRSYAKFEITTQNESERTHLGTIIAGRNAEGDGLNVWGFWPNRVVSGKATVTENKLSYSVAGQDFSGVKISGEVSNEIAGDEMTVSITNSKRGDESRPDMSFRLQRQPRATGP